ncbi:hypothetical protein H257_02325 [Aphanomyces astaci]|uniref:Leucine-rich repeat-containing N-terminal plant-type domain-containing protein n=1 Tax=Aphanomyces astaci TaxID=112090 RepID=W4H1F3_APHAT|nr:hypothetical protein H257_02325 [Aphanomyces astaci]ETV85732.1 hypothetical protein H257_02325 [Aphanomyces astaci]|eukprot:XP_009824204.1 hypothetical protein H257_02325 [Aphanomyces astaci]
MTIGVLLALIMALSSITLAAAGFIESGKMILLATCPQTNHSDDGTAPTVCLRKEATGSILTVSQDDPNSLRLNHHNISSIQGFPAHPHTIDLSSNGLRSINVASTSQVKVMSLNLRHNEINATGVVNLPPTLHFLDLGYNAISRMDATTTFNWTRLPQLTTLILTGNNLTTINRPSFPTSLTTLDLSGNNITSFIVGARTWAQLTRPGVRLLLSMTSEGMETASSWCPNSTAFAITRVVTADVNAVVCIIFRAKDRPAVTTLVPATSPPSITMFSLPLLVINVVVGLFVMLVASFVVVKVMERQHARLARAHEAESDTCTSSGADDLQAFEYRLSLSPHRTR